MAISLTAFAQTNVKGVVTDKNGEAVTGAMVLNKDNGKWAVTDAAGAFELEGAEKGQNLEITCMGYVDFTVSYKGEATLNIILQDDALQLEETVVIGYGSVRKKDLTGSVGVLNSQLIERHLDVDTLPAAIPMRWEDPHTRKYARDSLRRIIDFVERHTGETYDWDACRAVMEKHNDEVRNEQEKWGFMATPYTAAALAVPALFHTFYYAFSGGRNPEVMKTEHKVMRILEQAYADKTNCFPKTRYRAITWGGPPCYWLQFPNWLYNCWGILMIAGMDLFSGNVIIDTTDEETILDGIARNYETGVMRCHLTGGWRHLVEFWDEAEKFHCDMVILHDDITCKGALGLTGVILDQAKEKTTKLMVVSNDMFDHRTISRADIRQQVNDFMFSVMQAEPLDASLLQYDDYEGW